MSTIQSELISFELSDVMSTSQHILQYYKTIADITTRMLEKAYAGEWDEVVALGDRYQDAVNQLRELSPLSSELSEQRREYLRLILDNDAIIRKLAMPELERLSLLLGDMKRQRSALDAYRTSQD